VRCTQVAPYFAIGMVFFLMAFVGYFVLTVIALVLDFEAMDCACASESWVWLYVLLAIVIPTSLGFVMGLVKTGLNLADLKANFGWEIPAVFLSLPGPILYIVLAVLGWILWVAMEPGCDKYYASTVATLYWIFHIQVSCMYRIVWFVLWSVCVHAHNTNMRAYFLPPSLPLSPLPPSLSLSLPSSFSLPPALALCTPARVLAGYVDSGD